MRKLIICIAFLSFVSSLCGQAQQPEICGYQHEVEKILKKQPNFMTWQEAYFDQAMQEFAEMQSLKRRIVADTLYYEIPVVFHVLYNTADENISPSYIYSQLNELNLAFRKLTADTQRIREVFKPIAADVRVQFVLATRDPEGNPTNGITRTFTTKTTFAINTSGGYNDNMKYSVLGGKDAWNPSRYMNIWSCNMRYPNQSSMTLGFATPPKGAPNWGGNITKDSTDPESGIVAHFSVIGRNNPLAISNNVEGKTVIHEVGHYLGLRHTWGDGQASKGCEVDDGIFDTPNSRDRNYSCNKTNPPNTCTDASNDLPDQTENYMDYSLDGCAAMFTRQQAYLMRYVLNNLRTGLPFRKIDHDTLSDDVSAKIFPNPITEKKDLKILVNGADKTTFSISVIDMSGKQVLSANVNSNMVETIDISALAGAVYYVIIMDKDRKVLDRKSLLVY